MKPLELLRIAMFAALCGSIFLAMHLWPVIAEIIGSVLFLGGLGLASGVIVYLVRARRVARFMRIFGKSNPDPAEIRAWREYTASLHGGLRTTRVQRLDPRHLFLHNTVPHSDIPRRKTAKGPLSPEDRPASAYWTVL